MSMASHMSESVEPMRIPHAGLHPMETWGSSEGFGVQCGVGTPRTVRAGLAMCEAQCNSANCTCGILVHKRGAVLLKVLIYKKPFPSLSSCQECFY